MKKNINRRNFIKNGSLAGFGLMGIVGGQAAASPTQSDSESETGSLHDKTTGPDLIEMSISELQKLMETGRMSSKEIAQWYLRRIEQIDKKGPALNSVVEINPDALSIAEKMDAERKSGKIRSSLHGIPVLIKENIDSGDKMMTTAGSLALLGNRASKDAFIISRLRDAGAVLLGKTNLSEFANFRSTRSTSGWSSRGGQTKCPYVLDRSPSGSSSGSGAAVAASLCAIAIGTETNGSIVSPSGVNGLVGIKPTVGLWSRSGIIPISATQDTPGPMARTVTDAAIMLYLLAGEDSQDPATSAIRGKTFPNLLSSLSKDGLKGKRLGVEKSHLARGGNKDVAELFTRTLDTLKKHGAEIVEVELFKNTRPLGGASYTVFQYEFKDGLNKYLSTANARVKTLKEVIRYNEENADKAMPFFKQEILIACEEKGGLDSDEYKEALKKSTSSRGIIDGIMKDQKLDAICGITTGPSWCIDLVNGDYDNGYSFSSPAAMAGYPHITVPMGMVHHLPVGFSFMAGAWQEPELVRMAYAFEQIVATRRRPEFMEVVG